MLKTPIFFKQSLVNDGLKSSIVTDKIAISWLDPDKVLIKTATTITLPEGIYSIEGGMVEIINSSEGRKSLQEIQEPYKTAILAVWGGFATVDENGMNLSEQINSK